MKEKQKYKNVRSGYLVHSASRLFLRFVDRELRPSGISTVQLGPLLALAKGGPMLQRDLVSVSATAQPAMVATLARLERDALITRRPDERDGRATIVELTEKGREVAESAEPALQAGNDRALRGFSADERAALNLLLRRFIENLDDDT